MYSTDSRISVKRDKLHVAPYGQLPGPLHEDPLKAMLGQPFGLVEDPAQRLPTTQHIAQRRCRRIGKGSITGHHTDQLTFAQTEGMPDGRTGGTDGERKAVDLEPQADHGAGLGIGQQGHYPFTAGGQKNIAAIFNNDVRRLPHESLGNVLRNSARHGSHRPDAAQPGTFGHIPHDRGRAILDLDRNERLGELGVKNDMVLDLSAQQGNLPGHGHGQVRGGDHEQVGLLHGHLKADFTGAGAHRIPVRPVRAYMLVLHR